MALRTSPPAHPGRSPPASPKATAHGPQTAGSATGWAGVAPVTGAAPAPAPRESPPSHQRRPGVNRICSAAPRRSSSPPSRPPELHEIERQIERHRTTELAAAEEECRHLRVAELYERVSSAVHEADRGAGTRAELYRVIGALGPSGAHDGTDGAVNGHGAASAERPAPQDTLG